MQQGEIREQEAQAVICSGEPMIVPKICKHDRCQLRLRGPGAASLHCLYYFRKQLSHKASVIKENKVFKWQVIFCAFFFFFPTLLSSNCLRKESFFCFVLFSAPTSYSFIVQPKPTSSHPAAMKIIHVSASISTTLS